MILSIIVFLIILGILVLIHEFGHFIAAKKSGILVEEFGFGFPPRIFGIKIGETLYSINLFPLGGFVKLFGEEYDELPNNQSPITNNQKRAFVSKKPWQKTIVILGGVLMNLLLAVTIYYGLLGFNHFKSEPLPLLRAYHFRFGTEEKRVIVAQVQPNSPAAHAHVTTEDVVLRFKLESESQDSKWIEIQSAQELINEVKQASNKKVLIQFVNIKDGLQKQATLIPLYDKKLNRPIIGVSLIDSIILNYQTPKQRILSGFMHSYNIMTYNISTISYLFGTAIKEKNMSPVAQTMSGPIGILNIVSDIVHTSGSKLIINLLNVIALLSLSLALMNVLPFPALDGGRLVFVLYEWITGKKPNKTVEKYVNLTGFFILIILAILISINDILRMIK